MTFTLYNMSLIDDILQLKEQCCNVPPNMYLSNCINQTVHLVYEGMNAFVLVLFFAVHVCVFECCLCFMHAILHVFVSTKQWLILVPEALFKHQLKELTTLFNEMKTLVVFFQNQVRLFFPQFFFIISLSDYFCLTSCPLYIRNSCNFFCFFVFSVAS